MQKLVELVAENPDLPIIALVDGEVCGDDCGYWLGYCDSASIELVGCIGERYYTDFEEFMEVYYDRHAEELCEKFKYNPRCCTVAVERGEYTQEEFAANCLAEEELNTYLREIANQYMIKAIVMYVDPPEDSVIMEVD
jgi:hypothetical protein